MITVNMNDATSRLPDLVKAVEERGETVTICRDGKPVARLASVDPLRIDHFRTDPRSAGEFLEDPVAGVPEEAWPEEHRCIATRPTASSSPPPRNST